MLCLEEDAPQAKVLHMGELAKIMSNLSFLKSLRSEKDRNALDTFADDVEYKEEVLLFDAIEAHMLETEG